MSTPVGVGNCSGVCSFTDPIVGKLIDPCTVPLVSRAPATFVISEMIRVQWTQTPGYERLNSPGVPEFRGTGTEIRVKGYRLLPVVSLSLSICRPFTSAPMSSSPQPTSTLLHSTSKEVKSDHHTPPATSQADLHQNLPKEIHDRAFCFPSLTGYLLKTPASSSFITISRCPCFDARTTRLELWPEW